MVRSVVIADDLTGANATGVMLKKMGYRTSTMMRREDVDLDKIDHCDCLTFTTDSRGIEESEAYDRVYKVTKMVKSDQILLYSNRIDSTLRGNLGKETDAMLDALGEDYIALVVPCAPASGRVTIGGYMLVHGAILSRTEVALDPKTPILDSRVVKIFEQQTCYKTGFIDMHELTQGLEYLIHCIRDRVEDGARILVFDSITPEDIDIISDAALRCGFPFIAVDPGAFTASLTSKMIRTSDQEGGAKILTVVGSVNPVAKVQMETLWLSQPVYNVFAKTSRFLEGDQEKEEEIRRVIDEITEHADGFEILGVTGDGINPEHRIDLGVISREKKMSIDEISEIINEAFAEIAWRLMKAEPRFGGCYTSGGDITASVCRRFGALGIQLKDEVIPLAACGRFINGDFPGKWIVTKGGMTGNPDGINICIQKLKTMLNI